MKTNNKQTKKWLIGLSTLAVAGCFAIAGGVTLTASAADEPAITAQAAAAENMYMRGISVRYEQADGEDGIRFGAAINKSWYDGIVTANAGKEVKTGTIIVPTDLLTSLDYAGIMAAVGSNDATNTDTTEILESANSVFTDNQTEYYQTTVYMHSVPMANYNTELTAVAYIAIDGDVAYYTAQPCQHSVASAAKYLIDNAIDTNAALQDYLLKYIVTYYDVDGETVITTENVKYGETPAYAAPGAELKNPENIFEKWVTEKNGTTQATGAITGSTSVYAGIVDPSTTYEVTYKNYDGSVLATEDELVGKYPEYNGATPVQNGDMQTSYFFTGFGTTARVTKNAEYTAQYAKYKNMDNYYYCVNEKFTLPTQVGSEIEQYGLTYEFNGNTIEAGEEVEIPTAGKYTYTINVGELGSISTQVEVMDTETYYKNYLKTNTNQFYVNAGVGGGRIIYNGNNTLGIMNDGSYKYTNTLTSTYDARISLGSDFVGGSSAKWNIADYLALSFGIKLEEGTTLTKPTYVINQNTYLNGGVLWAMQFIDGEGNIVASTDMQAGVWYTAIVDLAMTSNAATNTMELYIFNAETGTIYLKDFQFDGVENPEKYNRMYFSNGNVHGYMKNVTETVGGVEAKHRYTKGTQATWGSHADLYISPAAAANYGAVTFRIYFVSGTISGTSGFSINGSGMKAFDATGNVVSVANMTYNTWYTIITTATLGSTTFRFYGPDSAALDAYLTAVRFIPKGQVTGEGTISVATNATLCAIDDGYTYLYSKGTTATDANAMYNTRIIFPANKTVTFDVCVLESSKGVTTYGGRFVDLNNGYVAPSPIIVKATGEAFTGATTNEMLVGTWYTVTFTATTNTKNIFWEVGQADKLNALIANVVFS